MYYTLSSSTDIVLQPYGAFLSSRTGNRFDVINRLGTAILLHLTTPKSIADIRERVTSVRTGVDSADVEHFIHALISSGYLSEHHSNDPDDPRGTVNFAANPNVLKATRADIEITNRCNLHCTYCYAEVNKSKHELSTDEWVAILSGMQAHGLRAVLFSGGEPFIRKDFVELVAWATKELIVEINSNGFYITEGVARRLAASKLKRVQISLDSVEPAYHDSVRGRGSHEAAVRAIKLLAKFEVPVQVSTVITKMNRDDLSKIGLFVQSIGGSFKADAITRTGFAKDIPDQRWEDDFRVSSSDRVDAAESRDSISHLLFIPLCQSQIGFIAISHSGILKPCNMRESFFEPTASLVLEARESRWWERFYGELSIGSAVVGAESLDDESKAALRKIHSGYLCELQLALIGANRLEPTSLTQRIINAS